MNTVGMTATNTEKAKEWTAQKHHVILQDRTAMTVTGVKEVVSCDEAGVCVDTVCGRLNVGGKGLRVNELSVKEGEIRVSGEIEFVQYTKVKESGASIWKRMMR